MKKIFILFTILLFTGELFSSIGKVPVDIGAQVFIEPGQREADVEHWFLTMHQAGMTTCRIRLFEECIRQTDGRYDFSLFDRAISYAAKYDIKVMLTLFPEGAHGNTLGGFKYPEDAAHLDKVARFIRAAVTHYKENETVYAWVLLNEAGGTAVPSTDFTSERLSEWKTAHTGYLTPTEEEGYGRKSFEWDYFVRDYNTWYLAWIANEIRKYDTRKDLHVNTHQIFSNVKEYDFPAWRKFLSSFGASAHPSWHFGYFDRRQYAMALSANCEIMKSGAGTLPFYITELQGGNNTYSGEQGFCPTHEEITQWLWTGIGTGASNIMFWSLNSRSFGEEAGEWAMLDFRNQPSDRLQAAASVAQCIRRNEALFANTRPIASPITLLYNKESLWIETATNYGNPTDKRYEGKQAGAAMKSLVTIYEVLAENGVKAGIGAFDEYDWEQTDYRGQTLILSHQISIPRSHLEHLRRFVRLGGKLIVEGLTGFYDEQMRAYPNMGFPLHDLLGGYWSEVFCQPALFTIPLAQPTPTHLWKSFVQPTTGKPFATENEKTLALTNEYGRGEVLWIPAMVALGARQSGDFEPLSLLLMKEIKLSLSALPFYFTERESGVLMETMQTDKGFITILINKEREAKDVSLSGNNKEMTPNIIFSMGTRNINSSTVTIQAGETLVVEWKK